MDIELCFYIAIQTRMRMERQTVAKLDPLTPGSDYTHTVPLASPYFDSAQLSTPNGEQHTW